jgi:hypothetical protein
LAAAGGQGAVGREFTKWSLLFGRLRGRVCTEACIAKSTRRYDFPDKQRVDASYTHSLRDLVKLAGLEKALADLKQEDKDFRESWELVESWREVSRYEVHTLAEAGELIEAIGARNHGVIRWIKVFW